MAEYKYEATSYNGDATTSYNVLGNFPVTFKEFFKWVLEKENSFRISFRASNKEHGGWIGNRLEVHKDTDNNKCYWTQEPENWFDEIKDKNITSVWANGGWGQMLYIVTFEEGINNG